jgi:excisionase family DNA binding protein
VASSSKEATHIDSQPNGRMFLTAAEVGHELGVRKSRVYELAASGMLPVIRLGRRMLFPRRGLEELADAAIERSRARMLSDPTRHIS